MLNAREQEEYLELLELPSGLNPTKENLDRLIYAHQTHIPFSTLDIGLTENAPKTDTATLFQKIVKNQRGGYCFELNKLFEELLKSLGYAARPALSRSVRGREDRMPINHRAILVELGEGTALVDVGFGGPMAAGALMLAPEEEQVICGENFRAVPLDDSWWKIDRLTKAKSDLYDDGVPARRQTELEACTVAVEDQDFGALNLMCSRPGTLFHDHEIANLRTEHGYNGYRDGVLTLRETGEKHVREIPNPERPAVLQDHFGIPQR